MLALPPYILYLLTFVCALFTSLVSIPRIIYVTKRKKLYDKPDGERKLHLNTIPNLGGIGIFFSYITITSLFISIADKGNPGLHISDYWNYIIASSIVLFLTGINDDLVSLSAKKKFVAQFIAAVITICLAHKDIRLEDTDIFRINSLHGLFGIQDMPYWYGVAFTVIGCVFVTNAFNLIDGIDGLAGSIGVLVTFLLGMGFAMLNNISAAVMSFSLMGAIIGFLKFNMAPAKIFMGDTGSLLIGFTIALLCIVFLHAYPKPDVHTNLSKYVHTHKGATLVVLSLLFVPVFDSFRVFASRIIKGGSPFKADRNHLHHYLLDLGYTHPSSVTILVISNILIIIVALLVQDMEPNIALGSIIAVATSLFAILYYLRRKKLARHREIIMRRNAGSQPGSTLKPSVN